MLGKETWCVVGVQVHLKGDKRGWGQGSVQATLVLPPKPWQTMSTWRLLCTQWCCHARTKLGYCRLHSFIEGKS